MKIQSMKTLTILSYEKNNKILITKIMKIFIKINQINQSVKTMGENRNSFTN